MIFLIQDSQGTSSATVGNIKTVVQAMLRRLSSESTDFNFALAKYATSRRISCFGSAEETISYSNNEYQHGGSGLNLLKPALSKMVLKQFDKRHGDRKTDTAKVRFTVFHLGPNYVINKSPGVERDGICSFFVVVRLFSCITVIVMQNRIIGIIQDSRPQMSTVEPHHNDHLGGRGKRPL